LSLGSSKMLFLFAEITGRSTLAYSTIVNSVSLAELSSNYSSKEIVLVLLTIIFILGKLSKSFFFSFPFFFGLINYFASSVLWFKWGVAWRLPPVWPMLSYLPLKLALASGA
jgi:hypothetical protein